MFFEIFDSGMSTLTTRLAPSLLHLSSTCWKTIKRKFFENKISEDLFSRVTIKSSRKIFIGFVEKVVMKRSLIFVNLSVSRKILIGESYEEVSFL
jgi:hypothetical protein